MKSYLQISNLSFGENSKLFFDKTKNQPYKNFYLDLKIQLLP